MDYKAEKYVSRNGKTNSDMKKCFKKEKRNECNDSISHKNMSNPGNNDLKEVVINDATDKPARNKVVDQKTTKTDLQMVFGNNYRNSEHNNAKTANRKDTYYENKGKPHINVGLDNAFNKKWATKDDHSQDFNDQERKDKETDADADSLETTFKVDSKKPSDSSIDAKISNEVVVTENIVKDVDIKCYDNDLGYLKDSQENIYDNVIRNDADVAKSDVSKVVGENICAFQTDDIVHRYVGAVFRSFRERQSKRRGWRRRSLSSLDVELLKPEAELSRSQYSLVSSNDLTAGAVQLWMGLPEEVKYDPALAPFRQFYEKEHGKLENKRSGTKPLKQRLPSVNSAPHLNNNLHIARDEPLANCEKQPTKMDKLLEEQETTTTVPKKSMVQKARHYVKMTLLLACWMFFTVAFLMCDEKELITRNSSVAPSEVKHYSVSSPKDISSIHLQLSGPFLSETAELKLNSTAGTQHMEVWMERLQGNEVVLTSNIWKLILQDDIDLDFSAGEPRSVNLRLKPYFSSPNVTGTYALRMRTTANTTMPFAMSYTISPLDVSTGVIYACILLVGMYILIIFEVINRTMAAVLVSTTALATLALVGERPTLPEIISWLDVETLLLLFSMMLLVAIMAETGMFDFLAVFTFEVTKGKLWPLISLLCAITAVLSTFLDNVTTVLLMTPVTIRLCEVMDLDPIPVLMSMVLFSNIGGTATPVGDPPNVIIASNKAVIQAGINFTNFTLHMTLGVLLVCVQTYIQLRFIYRDANKLRLIEPRDIQDLRHQISIWRRAAESLPHLSRDEHVVRERLERKVKKLTAQLDTLVKESNKRACPKDTFKSTLAEMKEKYKIRDKPLLIKSTIAIGFVVTVFFLHSIPELNRVSLGWTALLGAILLLTLADREDLEPILHRVEWSTLLFFAALFVLMEALSKLGLIEYIGGITESLILSVDEGARLSVAISLMLWVSGVTSAFVDNIPLTTMMVRVVTSLGSNPTLNLPMAPLIWALSFGACLGGNGTLIGASANVVCAGVAEQHGYKFSFVQFFKIGFPIMIGHLIVITGYLLISHCVFTWH